LVDLSSFFSYFPTGFAATNSIGGWEADDEKGSFRHNPHFDKSAGNNSVQQKFSR
jgi:hypothetical protein